MMIHSLSKHLLRLAFCGILALLFRSVCMGREPVATSQIESFPHGLGDMKLVDLGDGGSFVLGSVSSELRIKSADAPWSNFTSLEISTSWLGVERESESRMVVATSSGADPRVRVYRIDPRTTHADLLSIIEAPSRTQDSVRIDPAIIRVKDTWLATYTSIDGPVNSPQPNGPFGTYAIHLFSSPDLVHWKFERTLVEQSRNVEDPRFLFAPDINTLFFFYEQERHDRGPSSLQVMSSKDRGAHWSQPTSMLVEKDDVEPGGAFQHNGKVYLFFSSDQDQPGASYAGSKVFYLSSDDRGASWRRGASLPLGTSMLLMDTIKRGSHIEIAAIQDYLSEQKAVTSQIDLGVLR